MLMRFASTAACFLLIVATATAQSDPLQQADAALGVDGLRTLRFSAIGIRSQIGQEVWAAYPSLPVRTIHSYEASIDFDSTRMRVESDSVPSPTGGSFTGNQRQVQVLNDHFAWGESTQPGADPAKPLSAQPDPGSVTDQRFWLWSVTPQGVLKAAGHGAAHSISGGSEVSLTIEGRHVTAYLNDFHQVTRIETLISDPLLGDTRLVIHYTGYRDFGGIQFPSYISEYENDELVIALAPTEVKINTELTGMDVPANVKGYQAPADTVKLEKLADGVYWVLGASHDSMVVDMGNYLAMVEAPTDEARSLAVIAEVKKSMPGKPIRYVINTHVHSDHSGGLRTYVAEGATVVTQTNNRAFYEKAWANPRTLEPDLLSKSGKHATFMPVDDHAVIKGTNGRAIELHVMQGSPHDEDNLIAWLPAEGILFESDLAGGGPTGHPTPTALNFYDNLVRLNIVPQQIIGGHGTRVITMADLSAAVGKTDRH